MDQLTPDDKLKIIASEIFAIKNIQTLLKDSFSLKEFEGKGNIYPYLMLVEQMEGHIYNITKLIWNIQLSSSNRHEHEP